MRCPRSAVALDDLPLSLELAAARVKALTATQILERLEQRLGLLTGGARDQPERQRTLRAAIEWSFDLLTAEEQRLFARLGVFRGGCTLESAEEISGRRSRHAPVARRQEPVALLQRALLDAGDDPRVRGRAAGGFQVKPTNCAAGMPSTSSISLKKPSRSRAWSIRPRSNDSSEKADNLRAALDLLEASGETQLVLRFTAALDDFWGIKGYLAEGRRRLELASRPTKKPTVARAKALNAAADMARRSRRRGGCEAASRRGACPQPAIREHLGHRSGALLLGHAAADDEDYETARRHWEEAEPLFTEDRRLLLKR